MTTQTRRILHHAHSGTLTGAAVRQALDLIPDAELDAGVVEFIDCAPVECEEPYDTSQM